MFRRRVGIFLIAAVSAALVSATLVAPVAAQEGSITITDDSASITVIYGATTIQPGRASGPKGPIWVCDFWASTLITEPHTLITDRGALVDKEWYGRLCAEVGNLANNDFQAVEYNEADPGEGIGVSTDALRDTAAAQLPLDAVIPELSPEDEQITGVATWIWPGVDRQTPTEWASAGGHEVGVYGYLSEMEFAPGDGSPSFECANFTEWHAGATNPACTHTYLVESPGGTWTMQATTTWTVFWQDVGEPFVPYGIAEPADALDIPIVDLEAVIGG